MLVSFSREQRHPPEADTSYDLMIWALVLSSLKFQIVTCFNLGFCQRKFLKSAFKADEFNFFTCVSSFNIIYERCSMFVHLGCI